MVTVNLMDLHPDNAMSESEEQVRLSPLFPLARFDLVAIAASAGGLMSIGEVLAGLPADFPAGILIIQHLDPHRPSMMDRILRQKTSLIVCQAEDGMAVQPGTVYIAPPNRHLVMETNQSLALSDTAPVHFVRPSADVSFKSVALTMKNRLLAVILSGTGVDGASGVQQVKLMGGVVIVEDEATAQFDGMPHAAIRTGIVDYILPLKRIAPTILQLILPGDHPA